MIRIHASLGGFGFRVPHSKTYVISSEELLEIADRDELGFLPIEVLPKTVILLERPDAEDLEERPRDELLLRYWELLFHAKVHCQLEPVFAASAGRHLDTDAQQWSATVGGTSTNGVPAEPGIPTAERIAQLGERQFDEIRDVLRQERFLVPQPASGCADDASVYVEFAAVYLGLRYFKPFLVASFFPALRSLDDVDWVIAQDIDAAKLLAATRLAGTPDPEELCAAARQAAEALDADPFSGSKQCGCSSDAVRFQRVPAARRSEHKYANGSRRAVRQSVRGNFAGAAIRRAPA